MTIGGDEIQKKFEYKNKQSDYVRLDEGWTQEPYEMMIVFKDHNDIPVKATPANRIEIDPVDLFHNYRGFKISIMPFKEWMENEQFYSTKDTDRQ